MKKFYLLFLAFCLTNWVVYAQNSSLIGSYNFENGAISDESGNGNDLLATSTDLVSDVLGTADGALATRKEIASTIQFPNNFINRSEISISLFFKTSDSGVLLGIHNNPDYRSADLSVPIIYVGTDGSLRAGYWQGSTTATNVVTASTTVDDDEWHHVVLIAKSGTGGFQKVYLDNQLVGESSSGYQELDMIYAQLGSGKAQNWPVSAGNTTSFPIAASFDQVNIYDGIIDEATIDNLYNNAICVEIEANITPSTTLAGNGAISITVTEGAGPFTYLWSTGATSSAISNVRAGNYSVTITDSEACAQLFNLVVPDIEISDIANDLANTNGQINTVYKESTNETFFVYRDIDTELITVKKINSDLSITSLGNVDPVRTGVNPDINIHPITGEPWVIFVDINTVAVYEYDSNTTTWAKDTPGGNWNGYGVNPNKTILQFDPSGNAYVAHVNSQISNPGTIAIATNESGSWTSQTLTDFRVKIYDFQYPRFNRVYGDRSFTLNFSDANLDLIYSNLDESTGSWSSPIAFAAASFRTDQGLNFSNDGKYAVVMNTDTDEFVIRSGVSTQISNPNNAPEATSASYRQAKMIKSEVDGFHYLLFLNSDNELVLEQYNELNDSWRTMGAIDLTDGTNAFFSFDINSNSGDFNIIYSVERNGQRASQLTVISKEPEPTRIYVNKNAGDGGDGSSWSSAFKELRDALAAVSPATKEIWVAQGTYKPTGTTDVTASFIMEKDDLKVYGGFAGNESSIAERNLNANTSILSGDLAGNDPAQINVSNGSQYPYSDNSSNVIKIEADKIVIDGFTITGGTSVRPDPAVATSYGCVVLANGELTSIKLKNLVIEKNVAFERGLINLAIGGANDISFDLENVIIRNNTSVEFGVFYIEYVGNPNAELNMNNVLVAENDLRKNASTPGKRVGSFIGGYIRANNGTSMKVNIINSTFAKNTEERIEPTTGFKDTFFWIGSFGGGSDLSNVHNSIFTENQSVDNLTSPTIFNDLQTFKDGMGDLVFTHNISAENNTTLNAVTNSATVSNLLTPSGTIFAGPNDYKLNASSIARGAGDNSKVPVTLTTDLAGVTRILDGTVDLGAYEFRLPNFTAPTVITQNITVFLDANGNATILPADVNDGSSDDDTPTANLNFSLDINSFSCVDLGENTVTLSVSDFDNNIGTATAVVTVVDNIDPVIAIRDISLSLKADGTLSITGEEFDNGSTDNCSLNWSVDINSFDCTDLGENTIEVTITDDSGNSSSQTATLTIVDNIGPTIVTQAISLTLNAAGEASLVAEDLDNGSVDNCSSPVAFAVDQENFTCADLGENEVQFTVTDALGNASTKTVIVTVLDGIAPTVITQDITIELGQDGTASITPEDIDNGSSDNCSIATLSLDKTDFTTADSGENTVTLTAVDAGGNSSSATAVVVLIEVVKEDQIITFDAISDKSIFDADFEITATSNSGLAISFSIQGPATIANQIVSLTGETGTVVITASQAGNLNYNAATPVSVSFEVIDPCTEFNANSVGLTADITNSNSINGNGSITLNSTENLIYEWSGGQTGSSISDLAIGTYTVVVSNETGCSFQETYSVGGITANSEMNQMELSVFPNPAINLIQINNTIQDEVLMVLDMKGTILLEQKATEGRTVLDISRLPEGAYMLRAKRKNRYHRILKTRF